MRRHPERTWSTRGRIRSRASRATGAAAMTLAVALMLALTACQRSGGLDPLVVDAPPPLGTVADGWSVVRVEVVSDTGTRTFAARVAANADARTIGLQGVAEVPEGAGMLFVFPEPTSGGFWMKDTLVPLDIAFADAEGRIVALATMVPCPAEPCPVTEPGREYVVALEVAAGGLDGVAEGDLVTWVPR